MVIFIARFKHIHNSAYFLPDVFVKVIHNDCNLFFLPLSVPGTTIIYCWYFYSFSIHFRDHLATILNVSVGFLFLLYLFPFCLTCSFSDLACINLLVYFMPTCLFFYTSLFPLIPKNEQVVLKNYIYTLGTLALSNFCLALSALFALLHYMSRAHYLLYCVCYRSLLYWFLLSLFITPK